ncbi:MAG TPA: hypothetical protein VJO53_12230 [Candidatus Acidoferrales bacterium]|nr:hypothetical protein [Candidatus Acidoferrales bacterium]
MRFFSRFVLVGALFAATVPLAQRASRADELKLKDGSKITGTIVGFEDDSFKVKTSYGFAVVQKDQVLSISMADAVKASGEKKPEPAAEKSPSSDKQKTESAKESAPATGAAKRASSSDASSTPPALKNVAPVTAAPPTVAATTPEAASVPVASADPPKPPAPEPIREEVTGNLYTNDTYRFRMYKPPDWEVIAAAPAVLPGAITAMGTADDTTYLLIGQEPAGKSLATDMDATERRLRDVMENFRPLGESHLTISGTAATEHRFRGSVEKHDWSGVVVLVPRGAKLYTIFGMTRADNDLVQIQENVIARAISSLQFTEQ